MPAGDRLPERIEGAGLVLRRWLVSDADELRLAVAESADHLRPWMEWMAEKPPTPDATRTLLERWERDWREGGDATFGIFVDETLVGSCGLHRRRGPSILEIGYWIHAGYTRRGLATATARLLTDAAFDVPGIESVEIHHDKANVVSAGVPRKLGFRFVGEARRRLSAGRGGH